MNALDIKKHFPLLSESTIIYLDSAATAQKPSVVIDCMSDFYRGHYASVHRGIYDTAEQATSAYEQSRAIVASYINACPEEIVYTSGATDSINMVAAAWAESALDVGDEIVLPESEHHANMLVWSELAKRKKLILSYVRLTDTYAIDIDDFLKKITPKTKLVTFSLSSHVFGNYMPEYAHSLIEKAHAVGAKVLCDAAQAIGHADIDVQALKPDFLAFSGHKLFGPTGIGVLYVQKNMFSSMSVYRVGGGMVNTVQRNADNVYCSLWKEMPYRLEAGTPPFVQAIGLATAITFIKQHIITSELVAHEHNLIKRMIDILQKYEDIVIMQPYQDRCDVYQHLVSFYSKKFHAHDIAAWLNTFNIAVRAGHHCAQPIHLRYAIPASVRISVHAYTTLDDIDAFGRAMDKLYKTI